MMLGRKVALSLVAAVSVASGCAILCPICPAHCPEPPCNLPAKLAMAKTVRVAEPTVHSIGFEWDVVASLNPLTGRLDGGDADHNAAGTIEYWKKGTAPCAQSAAPHEAKLLRIDYQGWYYRCCSDLCPGPKCPTPTGDFAGCAEIKSCTGDVMKDDAIQSKTTVQGYRHFNMFAGSLMFLDPATPYCVRLTVDDPGSAGECASKHSSAIMEISTRSRPNRKNSPNPGKTRSLNVVPDPPVDCAFNQAIGKWTAVSSGVPGCTFDPATSCACANGTLPPNQCEALCDGSKAKPFAGFRNAEQCAQAGDTFLVHCGTYKGHIFTKGGQAGAYVAWVGAGDTCPEDVEPPAPSTQCPSARQEWEERFAGTSRLTAVRLRPPTSCEIKLDPDVQPACEATGARPPLLAPADSVPSLVVKTDHIWFEGFDLRPHPDTTHDYRGHFEAIASSLRSPRCPSNRPGETGLHTDWWGTDDVVIIGNAFSDFRNGVATGRWCNGAMKNEALESAIVTNNWRGGGLDVNWRSIDLSLAGAHETDPNAAAYGVQCMSDPQDRDGAIWSGTSPLRLDQRRADMHRHWYIADNVFHGGYNGVELIKMMFTADSDIAYNLMAFTQCRDEWHQLKTAAAFPPQCFADSSLPTFPWPKPHCQCRENDAKSEWHCPSGESGARCVCAGGDEPDAVRLTASTNIDVYGNDIRDIPDNTVHTGWTYANARFWRNRAIEASGNAFVNTDPMASAPWYVIRNEFVGRPGTNGDGTMPFVGNVHDRLVMMNNTFVVRDGKYGQNNADMMLRATSRNNLWILKFHPNAQGPVGAIWSGRGDTDAGGNASMPGQSHSSWRTDIDFDGFDWDVLPSPDFGAGAGKGTIEWSSVSGDQGRFTLSPPSSVQDSFQVSMRGCAGGPKDAMWCPDAGFCTAPYQCRAPEIDFRRVSRAYLFEQEDDPAIDAYAQLRFPSQRLVLDPTCVRHCEAKKCFADSDCPKGTCTAESQCSDAGAMCDQDADCNGTCMYCGKDDGVTFPNLAQACDQHPDLGAYERSTPNPTVHYGPRVPLGATVNTLDLVSQSALPCP